MPYLEEITFFVKNYRDYFGQQEQYIEHGGSTTNSLNAK